MTYENGWQAELAFKDGMPITNRSVALIAVRTILRDTSYPGSLIEPEDPEHGSWLVGLDQNELAELHADGSLDLESPAGFFHLHVELP